MSESTAYLSVRVPEEVRNRVKALAARRGESVQDLMGRVVTRLLSEEEPPPDLPTLIRILRGQEEVLRAQGIVGLWIFGSAARGDARPSSDIDLIVEFDAAATIPLTRVARLREDFADMLSRSVDLTEWRLLKGPVRTTAERDAVRIF